MTSSTTRCPFLSMCLCLLPRRAAASFRWGPIVKCVWITFPFSVCFCLCVSACLSRTLSLSLFLSLTLLYSTLISLVLFLTSSVYPLYRISLYVITLTLVSQTDVHLPLRPSVAAPQHLSPELLWHARSYIHSSRTSNFSIPEELAKVCCKIVSDMWANYIYLRVKYVFE